MAESEKLAELRGLVQTLDASLQNIKAEDILANLSVRGLTKLLGIILETAGRLQLLADSIDPIRQPTVVLDPSDPKQMGVLIGNALEDVTPIHLASVDRFYGSGVYALYYRGQFDIYKAIKGTRVPIYVGKADPDMPTARTPREQGPRLSGRLGEHARTIERADNLELSDFDCRFLVIQSGFQAAAEEYLIRQFRPVWNKEVKVCPGFGKHGDAARTELSSWDVLHSGRAWASTQESRSGRTPESVRQAVETHFRGLIAAEPELWRAAFEKSWVKAVLG